MPRRKEDRLSNLPTDMGVRGPLYDCPADSTFWMAKERDSSWWAQAPSKMTGNAKQAK
jgi:hypothetical protein